MTEKKIMKERVLLIEALNELRRDYYDKAVLKKVDQEQKNMKAKSVGKQVPEAKDFQNVKLMLKQNLEVIRSITLENECEKRRSQKESERARDNSR